MSMIDCFTELIFHWKTHSRWLTVCFSSWACVPAMLLVVVHYNTDEAARRDELAACETT